MTSSSFFGSRPRRPVAGGGGPVFGPPSGLTVTPNPAAYALDLSWTGTVNGRYIVEFARDNPATDPFAWIRATPAPIGAASFRLRWGFNSGEAGWVRVQSVDALGVKSAWIQQAVTMPVWRSLNRLSRWNSDLRKPGWFPDPGVTVAYTAGLDYTEGEAVAGKLYAYSRVTWTAVNQSMVYRVPTDDLGGVTMTGKMLIRGAVGQTITYLCHDQNASYYSTSITLTGDWQLLTLPRSGTFAAGTRGARIGFETYPAGATVATARSLDVAFLDPTRGTGANPYVKTQDNVIQEPVVIRDGDASSSLTTVFDSWHASTTDTPALEIQTGYELDLNGMRLWSRGVLITSTSNPKMRLRNSYLMGLIPATGQARKRAVDVAYPLRFEALGNYVRDTAGMKITKPREGILSCKLIGNLFDEIDGRIYDGGVARRSSYGETQSSELPPGAPIGWVAASAIQFDAIEAPTGAGIGNVEVAWNRIMGRPGHGQNGDVLSAYKLRGQLASPAQFHDNLIWVPGAYDFVWFDAKNTAVPYSYGKILTTFNLTVTVGTAAAAGAQSVTLTQRLFTILPVGLVLTFTGGKTATVRQAATSKSNSGDTNVLLVNPLGAALNAGDVATVANWQDGPEYFSGTDLMLGDSADYGKWENNSADNIGTGNITIGASGIQSICAGLRQELSNGELLYTGLMYDGVTPDDGSRKPFVQILPFGVGTAPDSSAVQRQLQADCGWRFMKLYGHTTAYINAPVLNARVTGNNAFLPLLTHEQVWQRIGRWEADAAAAGITLGPAA